MSKKKCKCKNNQEEDYYEGVTFVVYQSGNEPTDRLLKLMQHFTCEMHEMRIRTYWANQIGKPGGGGCVPGQQGCQ